MITFEDIENDETVKDFLRSKWIKQSSKTQYLFRLRRYSDFIGKKPSELIDEAEKEQDEGIKRRKRRIRQYIFNYIEYAKNDEHKSLNTIKNNIETIKSFYHSFDIDPPSTRGAFPSDSINPSFEELPTKEHIKKAVSIAGLRDRAIILLQLSSGMGAAEVRNLNYKQFIDSINEYIDLTPSEYLNIFKIAEQIKEKEILVGTWKVIRYKTGMEYITFSSTECTRSIVDYLLYRIQMNKNIKSLKTLLFVNQYNKPLNQFSSTQIYARINKKADLGKRTKNRNFLTSHMLRKLFTTTLYEEGLDKMAVDWMLGHKINQTSAAYFKAKPERLKQEYLKVENKLTLSEVEIRDIAPSQIKDIVRELDQRKAENEKMKQVIEEMDAKNKERDEYLDKIMGNKRVQEELIKRQ